ncbi:cAMP-dependent protein kinase inhibitor beta [Sarcophilus harrisii]|uniref:cAMP-dependent protein kinase inhibitor beta n=1 Tax=Sarcophilus harrisii TaxID=9305 RepID=UPI000226D2B6|nr:cAMP-dependent protein kinase inhibitor beta [Sarcophilus harrisii]
MTDVEPVVTEFSSSGRTGRRNALPDIRESSDNPESPLELPQKLENLNLSQSNAENTVADDPANTEEKQPDQNDEENKSEMKKESS